MRISHTTSISFGRSYRYHHYHHYYHSYGYGYGYHRYFYGFGILDSLIKILTFIVIICLVLVFVRKIRK